MAAVVLAIKFLDDVYYSNEFYSRIGGVHAKELNRLEADMIFMLDFDLNVRQGTYEQYLLAMTVRFQQAKMISDVSIASTPEQSHTKQTSAPQSIGSIGTVSSSTDFS